MISTSRVGLRPGAQVTDTYEKGRWLSGFHQCPKDAGCHSASGCRILLPAAIVPRCYQDTDIARVIGKVGPVPCLVTPGPRDVWQLHKSKRLQNSRRNFRFPRRMFPCLLRHWLQPLFWQLRYFPSNEFSCLRPHPSRKIQSFQQLLHLIQYF